MSKFRDHIVNLRFSQVFNTLLERRDIRNKTEMASVLGTYNHIVNAILKGERNLTTDQITKLGDRFKVDINFLHGRSDDMFHDPDADIESNSGNIRLLPIHAHAGDTIDIEAAVDDIDLPRFTLPDLKGDFFAIQIEGDSMYPTLTNGDVVVCQKVDQDSALRDNAIYIVVTDAIVAKRVQQIRNTQGQLTSLQLISDNEVYRPHVIDLQDVNMLLKVVRRITESGIQ